MSTNDSSLPIIQPAGKPPFDWKNRLAVFGRIGLLLIIAGGIRFREVTRQKEGNNQNASVTKQEAASVFPNDDVREISLSDEQRQLVIDRGEEQLKVLSTIPAANDVVGYRGPSHCLLLIDEAAIVREVRLLKSQDTPEHVDEVLQDSDFWAQFEGWQSGQSPDLSNLDAVSGATLTSLAVAEGIGRALGYATESLKFPKAISETEARNIWPDELPDDAVTRPGPDGALEFWRNETQLGTVFRSATLNDTISGYQGATEILVAMNASGQVSAVQRRDSWDNEPYASYMDDEPWYWDPFVNRSLSQIAAADLEELGIEGVSGATMTSLAAAETLIASAKEWERRRQQEAESVKRQKIRWTTADIGSVAVVVLGCLIAMTRLRSFQWIRLLWNVILVVYFGLMTGNLISLVVLFGWSASGVAWQLAPGLTIVVAAGLLLPALTKRNIYCSHLCPHGAAQQLLKRKPNRRKHPGLAAIRRTLVWCPGLILFGSSIAILLSSRTNLAAVEPFQAYIWYVSGTASLLIAVGSLIWSYFEPMAWCRYGCATGRLLDYVRLNAASTRIRLADLVVIVTAGLSWSLPVLQ